MSLREGDVMMKDARAAALGSGAFADVREGVVLVRGAWLPAALKIFRSRVPGAVSEARLVAELDHAHIVKTFGHLVQSEKDVIVMELVRGGTLWSLLHGDAPLPLEHRARIVRELAGALAYLHSRGVTHADLKPENVLLTAPLASGGACKVSDFGLAKKTGLGAAAVEGCGTLQYMAPELFDDPASKAPAADVYALGVVIWQVYARKMPYAEHSDAFGTSPGTTKGLSTITRRIFDKVKPHIQRGVRPSLEKLEPGTPRSVVEWMEKCWRMDPRSRPSAADVAAAFQYGAMITSSGGSGGGGGGGSGGRLPSVLSSAPALASTYELARFPSAAHYSSHPPGSIRGHFERMGLM